MEIVMESYSACFGVARRALLGMAILATASQTALADPTTLICHMDGTGIIENEPTTIELNAAQSSVVVHFAANHYNVGPGEEHAAWSLGPLPATFGADTISFSDPRPRSILSNFTINRLTGAFVETNANWRWTCQPGKKQF
jgi:hypothetical protein